MALVMPIVSVHGVEAPAAYIRIEDVGGGKGGMSIRTRFYFSQEKMESGCEWLQEKIHTFDPSVDDEAPNFIKQGYEHLKTLPEFAQATDA